MEQSIIVNGSSICDLEIDCNNGYDERNCCKSLYLLFFSSSLKFHELLKFTHCFFFLLVFLFYFDDWLFYVYHNDSETNTCKVYSKLFRL